MSHHFVYDCIVTHRRFKPLKRSFTYRQSLYGIDLDHLDELNSISFLLGYKKRKLVSFFENDHKVFERNLKDEILNFAKLSRGENYSVYLLTNLRNLGYVFNPISIYLIFNQDKSKLLNLVFEVGNTFGEQKLFLGYDSEKSGVFHTRFKKNYYISPFIQLDSELTVDLILDGFKSFQVTVSSDNESPILKAVIQGKGQELTRKSLYKSLKRHALNSFKIIFFIHLQALILFIKKVPYIKKSDDLEHQTGYLK